MSNPGRRTSGELIRSWREQRHLSQLEVANRAQVSTRHLCFIETGRSAPSRKMILRLARVLEVPIRARNDLLLSAGFAPMYEERPLDAPEMAAVMAAVEQILRGHQPYPALVINGGYDIIAANQSVSLLLRDVAPHLLEPTVNVIRVCLHPDGLAPNVLNYDALRSRLLNRLRFDVERFGSETSARLLEEVQSYPQPASVNSEFDSPMEIATSLRLRTDIGDLAFLTILAKFSTGSDVTVDEMSIESFVPADVGTAKKLQEYAAGGAESAAREHRSSRVTLAI